jgi:hypothetical protein
VRAHLKGMADLRRHEAQARLEEAEVLEEQIQELLAIDAARDKGGSQ